MLSCCWLDKLVPWVENDLHRKLPTHSRKRQLGALSFCWVPFSVLNWTYSPGVPPCSRGTLRAGHHISSRSQLSQVTFSPTPFFREMELLCSTLQTAEAAPFPERQQFISTFIFHLDGLAQSDICELTQIKENENLVLKHMFESINRTPSWMCGKYAAAFLILLGLWTQGPFS